MINAENPEFKNVYKQHVYDINLTEVYKYYKENYQDDKDFIISFENFYKSVLYNNNLDIKNVLELKLPVIITPNNNWYYRTALFYRLLITPTYLIPLLLNYHYYIFKSDKILFVQGVEHFIVDMIEHNAPKGIKKKKILKKLVKWIETKQEILKDYFLLNIFSLEKTNIAKGVFNEYSILRVKKNQKPYLELPDETDLDNLANTFIAYNEQSDMPTINKGRYVWNGNLTELTAVIDTIVNIEKNSIRLFKDMSIEDFIQANFLDKNKKSIASETIARYKYGKLSQKHSDTFKEHKKIIHILLNTN